VLGSARNNVCMVETRSVPGGAQNHSRFRCSMRGGNSPPCQGHHIYESPPLFFMCHISLHFRGCFGCVPLRQAGSSRDRLARGAFLCDRLAPVVAGPPLRQAGTGRETARLPAAGTGARPATLTSHPPLPI
jgi:hypothetical protein